MIVCLDRLCILLKIGFSLFFYFATISNQNKNLGEESSRYWHVILNKTLDFERYQKIADHVKKHTKLQVLQFFDKYIAMNGPCRHKLCVHVVAKQHQEASKDKGGENATTIEDPVEFRRSMPLFSMPAKTEVAVVDLGVKKSV